MPKLRLPILSHLRLRQIAADAIGLRTGSGQRAADQSIFDAVGISDVATDEGYYGEALNYHLGLLFAHANEPEIAARYFEASGTHPSSGGDQVFSWHNQEAVKLREQQQLGRDRGIPSILLAAMPRSASASLSASIARTLDIPIMGITVGRFPDYWLVPRWLNSFSPGGATTHDHLRASRYNVDVLRTAGFPHVFVQLRDPRAAARSFLPHLDSDLNLPRSGEARQADEVRLLEMCIGSYYPWLEEWLDLRDAHYPDLPVHVIKFNDVRDSMTTVVRRVLHLAGYKADATLAHVDVHLGPQKGNDNAWREAISPAVQRKLWERMPRRAIDLLELEE